MAHKRRLIDPEIERFPSAQAFHCGTKRRRVRSRVFPQWSQALLSALRRQKIQSLKAQLELKQMECTHLAVEIEAAASEESRAEFARRRDEALKGGNSLKCALARLEWRERSGS